MEDINEENRRAGLVKNQQTPIRVVVSNPPYRRSKRAQAIGAGSTSYKNVILEETNGNRPLIDDFIEPLKVRGLGGQAKTSTTSTFTSFVGLSGKLASNTRMKPA